MSEELEVLKQVTGRLAAAGIPYMVTGSMALNYYAAPRMTRDIDLVVELDERTADRIATMFEGDFYVDREAVMNAIRARTMFNLIHRTLIIKVDLVVRKDSTYRREEFSRRRSVSMGDWDFWIVAPEDLILSKLDWAKETRSAMQMGDARNLLQAVEGLDRGYLERWAAQLGVLDLYREVSS